jgi:hypothetical protein
MVTDNQHFFQILNKNCEIVGLTMKGKGNLKLGSLINKSLIDKISWNQLTSVNGEWFHTEIVHMYLYIYTILHIHIYFYTYV